MKKSQKITKITKEMIIDEIVSKYPKAVPVFMGYGLHCLGCPMALSESIEEAVKVHQGIDLDKLLKDLNKACLPVGRVAK